MYFYKDANNLFHIGPDILPPGNYILRVYQFESVVAVESADTHLLTMGSTYISGLQKEDNSYYVSLAELLFFNAEFFSMVTNEAAAGDHSTLINVFQAGTGVTDGHINDQAQTIVGNKTFSGQVNSGSSVQPFSASQEFDMDDGNIQEMEVIGDTTIDVTNEQAGTYLIWLPINSIASPTITIGASFGDELDNSGTLLNADDDVNLITLAVSPSGLKKYSINTQTA